MPSEHHSSAELAEDDTEEEPVFPLSERRIVTQPLDLSVQTLFDQWNEKLLLLPPIQREYVWDNGKASRLIESLLLNIPIPVLYLAENIEAKYEIFDGHQRIRSIARYINNEFSLTGLSMLSEHKGKKFFQLPEKEQRFLRMRTLRVILITIDSHPNMKFEVYERLNTGSIVLNSQELRNSLYRGAFNDLLHELAREGNFRNLMGAKAPRRRMVDEELILRFFAIRAQLNIYRTPLKRFLNEYMHSLSDAGANAINEHRSLFVRTIASINRGLDSAAFRVLGDRGLPSETVVNRALFEAQMLAFSWAQDVQSTTMSSSIRSEVARLCADDVFLDSIQRATGDRSRTLRRVREMVGALRRAGLVVDVPFDLSH